MSRGLIVTALKTLPYLIAIPVIQRIYGHHQTVNKSQRLFEEALEAIQTGKTEKAIQLLRESIDLDPENFKAYVMMGDICLTQKRYYEGINFYREAITLAGKDNRIPRELLRVIESICLNSMGDAYSYLGEDRNSLLTYELAHECCPDNPYAVYHLAAIYAREKNVSRMCYFLEKAIPLMVDTPYFQEGSCLVATILQNPDFEEYRDLVVELLQTNGKIS